jgi:hypothetical protein
MSRKVVGKKPVDAKDPGKVFRLISVEDLRIG